MPGLRDLTPGSGRVPQSPPASFPLYGLDASWSGPRWVEGFGDKIGDPPRWVALAHESADGQALIRVTTYCVGRTDAQAARLGQPPLADVALDAAHVLINLTLPAPSVPRPDGFLAALTDRAAQAASQYAGWPTAQWQVDGVTAAARRWQFAGGWAAVSDAVDGVYLAAAGVGAARESLSLARLRDGRAYHVDLTRPLSPGLLTASRQAAGAQFEDPPWKRRDWHEDQLRLIRALPSA